MTSTQCHIHIGICRKINTHEQPLKFFPFKVKRLQVAFFVISSVADVAVIGVPDVTWGQKVTAVVQMKKGHGLTLTELKIWARY